MRTIVLCFAVALCLSQSVRNATASFLYFTADLIHQNETETD
jgi:hypothetical protein